MSETILVALFSLVGTLGGSLAGIVAANKLVMYRIQQLEDKVEKHNQVVDRVYKLEQKDAVEKKEIKVINHRIEDLEQYHK